MAITVKHKFVSTIPDGTDTTVVRPSNWNDDHQLTGTVPIANGGTGAADAATALSNLGAYPASNPAGYGTGSVTSVGATAGTGINITGSPITTSGSFNITNTAPDQTVVLNNGTGISVTGTYPNFTISNTSPSSGGTVTNISTGIGLSGGPITTSGTINFSNSAVATFAATPTSANLAAAVSDETGSGSLVFNTNPSLSSPTISGGTINNASIGATTRASGDFTTLSANTVTSTTPVLSFNAANSIASFGSTTANSYNQLVIQNLSGTTGASTNYVISNNLGTDSTYYGEFGMNASTYSSGTPADFFSLNNGVYFSGHDGDVTIGSGNGYKTYFAWGTSGNHAHTINASGAIGLDTSITGSTNFGTSGQVLTSQGNTASPIWATPTTGTVTSVAALTLGTTGTDLSSSVANGTTTPVITLNVPTASSTNRGALSSTDWTTFNNKQAALVSGTNIKTVSGVSLLGSGDVGVIGSTYGGTGVNNGSATLTMAGSVTHAGSFTQSFTATGNTAVTLPTTGTLATLAGTETFTNKRVTPRAITTTSSATPTINTDNTDIYGLTAQAVDITSFTTNLSGTPTDGQKLWIYIVGTAARAITWGASFESSTATLPTTTVSTNRLDIGFVWNTATSKWRCVAVA